MRSEFDDELDDIAEREITRLREAWSPAARAAVAAARKGGKGKGTPARQAIARAAYAKAGGSRSTGFLQKRSSDLYRKNQKQGADFRKVQKNELAMNKAIRAHMVTGGSGKKTERVKISQGGLDAAGKRTYRATITRRDSTGKATRKVVNLTKSSLSRLRRATSKSAKASGGASYPKGKAHRVFQGMVW